LHAGTVGRIIVGRPAEPGAHPFDFFRDNPPKAGWRPVPAAAQQAFPPIERILAERVVPLGRLG